MWRANDAGAHPQSWLLEGSLLTGQHTKVRAHFISLLRLTSHPSLTSIHFHHKHTHTWSPSSQATSYPWKPCLRPASKYMLINSWLTRSCKPCEDVWRDRCSPADDSSALCARLKYSSPEADRTQTPPGRAAAATMVFLSDHRHFPKPPSSSALREVG